MDEKTVETATSNSDCTYTFTNITVAAAVSSFGGGISMDCRLLPALDSSSWDSDLVPPDLFESISLIESVDASSRLLDSVRIVQPDLEARFCTREEGMK